MPTINEDVGNKFNNMKSTFATQLMSEQKDIMKIATRQKFKHVTSEQQVGYQLSQREAKEPRGAKRESCQGDYHDKQNLHDQKHLHF